MIKSMLSHRSWSKARRPNRSTPDARAAIIGEYLTGIDGLGSLFSESFSRFKITRAWGASILIVALSIVSYAIASRIEERGLKRWT